jgi:UDP-MurNAc hydroxylase
MLSTFITVRCLRQLPDLLSNNPPYYGCMKVQFIHHASFLLSSDSDGISILTDPWYFGSAFLDGWDLMWPLNSQDLDSMNHPDYIWISHEHPDHFSIPTLKNMAKFSNSTFLFQQTLDQRVVEYLKSNGFKIQTVPNGELLQLSDSVSLLVRSIGTGDSYCIFQIDDRVFVNTNDAILLPRDVQQLQEDACRFEKLMF